MRFNNIQVLRLVAAVGVVVTHLSPYAEREFGVSGPGWDLLHLPGIAPAFVPLFFAVSGFVLTHALQSSSPGRFLLHRAVRLYPGYWLTMGAVTAACAVGLWPGPYLSFAEPNPTAETVLLTPPTAFRLGQYPLVVEWTLIYEMVLVIGLVACRLAVGVRGLPYAAAAWLAVLAVKSVVAPGMGSASLPSWKTAWVSVYVAPFLMGVLAYSLAGYGRRWRWPVFAVACALQLVAALWVPFADIDPHQWLRGVAAGLTVWFLVQVPDVSATNRLAVGGGYSYGLYLVHVPLLLLSFRLMQQANVLVGTSAGAALAGVVAITAGLAFGRFELWMHGRLKRGADRLVASCGRLRAATAGRAGGVGPRILGARQRSESAG
ncbi:acyltransferase family protein [Urbifossiella limnaea]|uniref:Acyltransferase family protein n=1 Tax=Urbifossiella limnaea TaxID=2528023 RepID=A0A517XR05_9BACT|nr:acyltransferase [Urbifossiella limnaea]QDU19921.1 Acyltransferase family protein [Urbifossiella limnaea]